MSSKIEQENTTTYVREFCSVIKNSGSKTTLEDVTKLVMLEKKMQEQYLKSHNLTENIFLAKKHFTLGNHKKALNQVGVIQEKNYPFANCFPFKKNDVVNVIRYEHGWMDGNMVAVILHAEKNMNGVWSYQAQVIDDDGNPYEGYIIEIAHTRDAYIKQ